MVVFQSDDLKRALSLTHLKYLLIQSSKDIFDEDRDEVSFRFQKYVLKSMLH